MLHKKPSQSSVREFFVYSAQIMTHFYLLRHTSSPAVLTENLFMDNPADCAFLLSPEGQQALVDLYAICVISYLGSL